jgi:hypothetical protein
MKEVRFYKICKWKNFSSNATFKLHFKINVPQEGTHTKHKCHDFDHAKTKRHNKTTRIHKFKWISSLMIRNMILFTWRKNRWMWIIWTLFYI